MNLNKNELALTILRVVLGVTFLLHGLAKLDMTLAAVSGWFASIGLPGGLAYVVTFIEIAGGLLLILGLFTRYASAAVGAILLGAMATVKASADFMGDGQSAGYELDLVLLAVALFFVLTGRAGLSLDELFFRKNARGASAPPKAL